jgi:hypothetical protein
VSTTPGRPIEKNPRKPDTITASIGVGLIERLDAFCSSVHGCELTRTAVVRAALVRLLDACHDDPLNLFTK